MAQLVICRTPNHPHSRRGDVEEIFKNNVELSGSGYADKRILRVPFTKAEMIAISKAMLPTYEENETTRVITYQGHILRRKPKNRANLRNLTAENREFIRTSSKIEAETMLKEKVISCFDDQLEELRK